MLRGDLQVNEVKLTNLMGGRPLRPMEDRELGELGIVAGYASPIGAGERVRVVADLSIPDSPNLVAGANRPGAHVRNVNYGRDWTAHEVADIARAEEGHRCVGCGEETIRLERGIELGHVFRLGQLYSEAFDAGVLDDAGERRLPTMGCYGIGVDRIVSAAVEAAHDDDGIRWPASIAPYDVSLVALRLDRDPEVAAEAEALYEELRRRRPGGAVRRSARVARREVQGRGPDRAAAAAHRFRAQPWSRPSSSCGCATPQRASSSRRAEVVARARSLREQALAELAAAPA